MWSQKFHLHVQFITRLNTLAHVWAQARVIARLLVAVIYVISYVIIRF